MAKLSESFMSLMTDQLDSEMNEAVLDDLTEPSPACPIETISSPPAIEPAEPEPEPLQYPSIRRNEAETTIYHGVMVADPYRHLEDTFRDETRSFVEEQNALFQSFISRSRSRSVIKQKLFEHWNYPKINVPFRRGTRYFYWENSGLQNQNTLFVKESLDGEPRVLLDPNVIEKDGSISIPVTGVSSDGQYLGYGISENGSDWTTIKIRDVNCAHDLDDVLRYSKLTAIRWSKDNKGFFYQRYPVPWEGYGQANGREASKNLNMKVYYHKLGTFQDDDILVVEFPQHPTWTIGIELSDDSDYLFVYASDVIGEKNLYYINLQDGIRAGMELHLLFDGKRGSHYYLANDKTKMYFVTNVGAPNNHIISFDLARSGRSNWTRVVPENPRNPILRALVVDESKLVICYTENVKSKIEVRNLIDGTLIQPIPLPPFGTVSGLFGRRTDKVVFLKYESYTNPGTIYSVDFQVQGKADVKVYKEASLNSMKLSDLEVTQLSYSSDDGTNIPIYILHEKDLVPDGNRPCLLTAYGGYGVSTMPHFSATYAAFAHHFKGVVAIPTIRGGGEFGKRWWDDGRLLNKQNGFHDFIAAARFLVHNKYTKPEKLAIEGYSNGGLLIGAVVNQQPELFGAAIPQVGIMDMLRFHKFTIGHLWVGEFGSSEEDETQFNYLRNYSPLHNIGLPTNGQIQYPAILVTTADHDDRVVPAHSYKYVAELQHTVGGDPRQINPLLIRIDSKCGHGYGSPTKKLVDYGESQFWPPQRKQNSVMQSTNNF